MIYLQSLNVEFNPSMKQYVALLQAVCESSPLATGDVVQDVSVIFAKLGRRIYDIHFQLSMALVVFPFNTLALICLKLINVKCMFMENKIKILN